MCERKRYDLKFSSDKGKFYCPICEKFEKLTQLSGKADDCGDWLLSMFKGEKCNNEFKIIDDNTIELLK